MRVIAFESYAVKKARRAALVAAIAALTTILLVALSQSDKQNSYWWSMAAFVSFAPVFICIKPWTNAFIGARGENLIEKELAELDDRYVLVRNWVPTFGRKIGDIDLLLFGPHGVLVIEAKTYSNPTKCEGDKWFIQVGDQGYWKTTKSPSSQLRGNLHKVEKRLKGKTNGVVVFNDNVKLTLSNPTVHIIHRKDLLFHVLGLPSLQADADGLWSSLSADLNKSALST